MALSATTVLEVRTTGSESNGGGFDSAATGTDRSQQDAAYQAYTDLVIDATTNTKITSAAHPFDSTSPGNIINITGGTGFTVQRVQIVSVAAGVATCEKAVGTTSSTGGTGNLGGALASPGMAAGLVVTSNLVWVKAGTYSIASTSANVATGKIALSAGGAATAAMRWEGYQTSRGDKGTPPIFQVASSGVTSITVFSCNAQSFVHIDNISFDGQSKGTIRGLDTSSGGNNQAFRIKSANCTNRGISFGAASDTGYAIEATGCTSVFAVMLTSASRLSRFYVHGNTAGGITCSASNFVISEGVCYANSGGSDIDISNLTGMVRSVTCHSNSSHAPVQLGSTTASPYLMNVIAYGTGGSVGFATSAVSDNAIMINCAGGNNSSNYTAAQWRAANIEGFVTLTGDPCTNAASGDFSLNNTAGAGTACRAAGMPGTLPGTSTTGYLDIGAVQSRGAIFVIEDD